jgi:hypothetical protein
MKKQLLIAAVAATMGTAAIADVAITGNMKANAGYTDVNNGGTVTNKITHETNLVVVGKSGDTTVHMEVSLDANTAAVAGTDIKSEDVWLSTVIAGVTAKAGVWNGSDSILSADSDRGNGENLDKYSLSGSVSGVKITVEGKGTEAQTGVTLATDIAGVAVSYKNESGQDQFKASGSVSGLSYALHHLESDSANSNKTSVQFGYTTNGVTLSAAQATTDSSAKISGDSYFGNVATMSTAMENNDDIFGFGADVTLDGTTLKARAITMEDFTTSSDVDIIKFIATRKLAGGTTLEITYTDEDSTTAAKDRESLDVELSVSF